MDKAITVELGSGAVRCQVVSINGTYGIVFDADAGIGEIGESADTFVGESLRPGQVLLLCKNKKAAEVLLRLSFAVAQLIDEQEAQSEEDHGEDIPEDAGT